MNRRVGVSQEPEHQPKECAGDRFAWDLVEEGILDGKTNRPASTTESYKKSERWINLVFRGHQPRNYGPSAF
jgi:hypothetical protein